MENLPIRQAVLISDSSDSVSAVSVELSVQIQTQYAVKHDTLTFRRRNFLLNFSTPCI